MFKSIILICSLLLIHSLNLKSQLILEYDDETIAKCNPAMGCPGPDTDRFALCYDDDRNSRVLDRSVSKFLKKKYQADLMRITDEKVGVVLKKKDMWGIIDFNGKEILPFKFDSIYFFTAWTEDGDFRALLVQDDSRFGFMDTDFNYFIQPKYEYLYHHFKEDIIIAKLDGKYGCIDKMNNVKIPLIYDTINYDLVNKIFIVGSNNKLGVRSENNEVIFDIEYDYLDSRTCGWNTFYVYGIDGKYGLFDSHKKITDLISDKPLVKLNNITMSKYSECLFIFSSNGKHGIVTTHGEFIFDPIYDQISLYFRDKTYSRYGHLVKFTYDNQFDNSVSKRVTSEENFELKKLSDYDLLLKVNNRIDTLNIVYDIDTPTQFVPINSVPTKW